MYQQGSNAAHHSNQGGSQGPVGIPIHALTSLGVAPETVGQMIELKNYLSRQFGLGIHVYVYILVIYLFKYLPVRDFFGYLLK